MKKLLLIIIVILFGCFINPVRTFASGEQSVLGQIGKDGDYLINNSVVQRWALWNGKVETCGNDTLLWDGSEVSFFGRNENGFWDMKQEFENYPRHYFGHMILSGNTAVVNALRSETEDGNYGALYIFERNENRVWRQSQKISGYNCAISENMMMIGERYYSYFNKKSSFEMHIYERDQNGVWQEKQIVELEFTDDNIPLTPDGPELTPYYPGAINNNYIIICSHFGAFIFERDATGIWKFTKRIKKPVGETDGDFGVEVITSGNQLYFPTSKGTYVFEKKSGGAWQQTTKLPGHWERISGDYAITVENDSIYIFERDQVGTWQRKQELTANIEKGDNYYYLSINDKHAGFIRETHSDYLYKAFVFERGQDGVWQQRLQTASYGGVTTTGTLNFYNNGVVNSQQNSVIAYNLNLSNQFIIPNDQKFLVFKVAQNSLIKYMSDITNKIRFETIGVRLKTGDSTETIEDVYQLSISKGRYIEGTDGFYYIVDISELRAKYIEECNDKFQLQNPGAGYAIYGKVGLRIRYDSSEIGRNLKDAYVTDRETIINVQPNLGGATISWTEIDDDEAAKIVGYQIDYTDTPTPPQKSIKDLPILKVPYETKNGLSASKIYYVWVRAVNNKNEVSQWVSQKFSPKPKVSAFVATECTSTATTSGRKPQYEIKLKVKDADVAQYIIQRQEYSKPETLITVNTLPDKVMSANSFLCSGGSGLSKHGKYEYFITTKNALGEASERSTPVVMNVQNLPPRECIVMKGWREIEVNDRLSLKLGLKADLEGDPLTYRLYIRTPGASDAKQIAFWNPDTDYLDVKVPYTFSDKTSYEWQVRCIEKDNPYGAGEYANKEWYTTKIDTDALIILATNDTSKSVSTDNFWSTKKQPVKFEIETNPNKTYNTYQWTFGDGSTAAGLSATHAFTNLTLQTPYEVWVTAFDGANVQHTGAIKINVVNTYKGKLYDHEEWSGTPTIESEVVIPAGLTLTLMPGSKLQMQVGSSLRIYGILRAEDANGGITITPQKENLWKGIIFQGSGSGALRGVTVSNAEIGITAQAENGIISLDNVKLSGNQTGLDFFTGTLTANNCLFQSNTAYGVHVEDEIYPALTKCIFTGNQQHYVDFYGELTEEDVNKYPGGGENDFQD